MSGHPLPRHQRRLLPTSMLLIATTVVAASPLAPTLTGKVVKIADGDTLTLLVGKTQIKVRLEGIHTPERAQPFGQKARQALAKAVTIYGASQTLTRNLRTSALAAATYSR